MLHNRTTFSVATELVVRAQENGIPRKLFEHSQVKIFDAHN